MTSRFKHYPVRPDKLTASFVKKEYSKLLSRLPNAEKSDSPESWIKLFRDWNALCSYINSEGSRISHNYSKNMADLKLEQADEYFREKIYPAVAEPEYELTKAILASRHKKSLAECFGKQLLVEYELALRPMHPINTKLRVKAGNISNRYDKTIAKAEVVVGGQRMNLSKARSLSFSDDRKLRQEAYCAVAEWVLKNQTRLAGYYETLVNIRDQMAKNLNYESYVPMAYELRGRYGYGPAEVHDFRQAVLKYVVPVYGKYLKKQARDLGIQSIQPWDINYNPMTSIPLGSVPVGTQLNKADKVFSRLSPRLRNHFRKMIREELIDLETRPNKKGGAYCTNFSDEGKAALLCNSTGDADDIRVLMHEMGHAFQLLESQHIEAVDLHWGTAELAEVYSMGMEFLSLPHIDTFFGLINAKKFSIGKWADSLYALCYVCVVDEFQHWVYENPLAKNSARDRAWVDIYSKYLGAIDFRSVDKYRPTRWYLQTHIFEIPFYYIDYALAEVSAMQLAIMAEENQTEAINLYLQLCKLGGTQSFLQSLKTAGLKSPFSPQLMPKLMRHVEKNLMLVPLDRQS